LTKKANLVLYFGKKPPVHRTVTVILDICGLYYKIVTIVIYDSNDSGQYYKTTTMIIIDDPSLS
jgi:hypothetical protein